MPSPLDSAGKSCEELLDARHARPVADALVASGAFTVDMRMQKDQWFRWKSGILAPCGCNCRRLNAIPAFRREVDDALADAARSSFPGADYIVAVAHAGIPWAKTLAERLDLPLAYVRAEARGAGSPQVLASAREAGMVSAADISELLRFYADPRQHVWSAAGDPSSQA
jgi:orotate phosphoribosyltransferase-like protein